jgi:hypothetical protein
MIYQNWSKKNYLFVGRFILRLIAFPLEDGLVDFGGHASVDGLVDIQPPLQRRPLLLLRRKLGL